MYRTYLVDGLFRHIYTHPSTALSVHAYRQCRYSYDSNEFDNLLRCVYSQQHGFFHAGVVSTIADSAAGYAAYSLFPTGSSVLTVEFKINLLAPADGENLRATGRVIKHGKTLTICEMQAFITKSGEEKLCAHGMSTLMCLRDSASLQAG